MTQNIVTSSSWSQGKNFIFQKLWTSAKFWALKSINYLFLKFPTKYLSNKEPTVFITMMVQNIRAYPFFIKFIKIMTPFHKKH